ncbi:MAG: HAMP domain-containing histidine kinase [Parabacteroides sp.]|nr:HAMP domain-containing histidine kinase [Parabacteroides sp.]
MNRKSLYDTGRFRRWIGVWVCLAVCYAGFAGNGDAGREAEKDSLHLLFDAGLPPGEMLLVVTRLAKLYMYTPAEPAFLERQAALAARLDSVQSLYNAFEALSCYYYNVGRRDSLLYWTGRLDSLAARRNEYPDGLYDARSRVYLDLLWEKNYEEAMDRAVKLYRLAESQGHRYGLARSAEGLGLIFQAIRRDSDAVASFRHCLDLLETMPGKEEVRLRVLSYQAESSLRTNRPEETEAILARYKEQIDRQAERNRQTGGVYRVEHDYWLLYIFYTDLYLRENKLLQAGEALRRAGRYAGANQVEEDYAERAYLSVKANYYRRTGNNVLALKIIDSLLTRECIPEDLRLKADILEQQGRTREVLALYDEIHAYNFRRNNELFLRQLGQLRTLHELHNQEVQAAELEQAARRMGRKQVQLVLSGIVSLALLVLLYVLYVYYRRARRLKNELLDEKKQLLESERKLIEQKEKAEEASRMKSAFLANMSHEIRTPMNAIVGFSGLLVDDEASDEEKKEYTSIIHNNTELLLNLLTDVLDLTRMETGDMQFRFGNHSLEECCRKALDSIRQRVPEGVELTFTPGGGPVTLYTDAVRLQQLLINLLVNATKFTRKGEINLAFTVEKEQGRVRIAVTDTGCGIPPEKQALVFNRFERLDDVQPGVGLGLSICSVIAERLGGTLSIDPAYTGGARFVLVHPWHP